MTDLSPDMIADLQKSGIADFAEALGFRAVRPADLPMKAAESGYKIPYHTLDGSPNCFYRIKFVPSVIGADGKQIKYWQEPGSGPHLYLPPVLNWRTAARNVRTELTLTEGEKKAVAGCAQGLITAGIGGVWCWTSTLDTGDKLTLPMLDEFQWADRPVLICPDSDAWRDDDKGMQILRGFFGLARDLQQRGANVQFVVLPDVHGVKAGLDDWLLVPGNSIEHGWDKLDRLPLDHVRFNRLNVWWQGWREKHATHDALKNHGVDDLVLHEVVGLYTVRAATHSATFTFDRLHEQRGAYHAELTVTLDETVLLDAVDINLKSDAGQIKLVTSLKTYSTSIPWKVLLQKACALVLRRHRRGDPPVNLNRDSLIEPLTFAINPLVPRKKSAIVFADGGKGKSTFALMLAMGVSIGQSVAGFSALPGKALYLDWEDDADVHTRRLHAIRAGHPELDGAEVRYQRCCEPLTKLTYDLARTIQREGITFIVIDSLLAAMGGEASAEAVGKFFAALRVFQVESLLIGHTPKTITEGQEHATVYGSVFNQNFARAVWELKTEQEIGEDSAILGLFHRKSNLTRKHPPIGLKVTHNQDGSYIRYEPFDLTKAAEMVNALPLPNRIRNLLDSDGLPRTSQQVADDLGAKLNSVKTTLSNPRYKGFKWSMVGDGKEAKWTTITR